MPQLHGPQREQRAAARVRLHDRSWGAVPSRQARLRQGAGKQRCWILCHPRPRAPVNSAHILLGPEPGVCGGLRTGPARGASGGHEALRAHTQRPLDGKSQLAA